MIFYLLLEVERVIMVILVALVQVKPAAHHRHFQMLTKNKIYSDISLKMKRNSIARFRNF